MPPEECPEFCSKSLRVFLDIYLEQLPRFWQVAPVDLVEDSDLGSNQAYARQQLNPHYYCTEGDSRVPRGQAGAPKNGDPTNLGPGRRRQRSSADPSDESSLKFSLQSLGSLRDSRDTPNGKSVLNSVQEAVSRPNFFQKRPSENRAPIFPSSNRDILWAPRIRRLGP